jgi:hypothetical protein
MVFERSMHAFCFVAGVGCTIPQRNDPLFAE